MTQAQWALKITIARDRVTGLIYRVRVAPATDGRQTGNMSTGAGTTIFVADTGRMYLDADRIRC